MTTAHLIECPDCNLQFTAKPNTDNLAHPNLVQCINCSSLFELSRSRLEPSIPTAKYSVIPLPNPAETNNPAAPLSEENSEQLAAAQQFNVSGIGQIDLSQDFQSLQEQHLHQTGPQEFAEEPELFWDDMPNPYAEEPTAPPAAPALAVEPIKPRIASDFHFDSSVDFEQPLKNSRNVWLWTLGALLAAVLLLLQWSHANITRLADSASLRPALGYLCAVTGCQLPLATDLTQIATLSLNVRPHPSEPATLQLNAIIENQAAFAQPFPNLLLSFKNNQGHTLLTLNFKPQDYLAGELAGASSMPSTTPVHIALKLVDLGSEATQYQMSFY